MDIYLKFSIVLIISFLFSFSVGKSSFVKLVQVIVGLLFILAVVSVFHYFTGGNIGSLLAGDAPGRLGGSIIVFYGVVLGLVFSSFFNLNKK